MPLGVVNQVETQIRISRSQGIQLLKRNAALERTVAPLLIHIGGAVTGQGCHHPDRCSARRSAVPWFRKDEQGAAIQNPNAQGPGTPHDHGIQGSSGPPVRSRQAIPGSEPQG